MKHYIVVDDKDIVDVEYVQIYLSTFISKSNYFKLYFLSKLYFTKYKISKQIFLVQV